jgi:hypothetical protein
MHQNTTNGLARLERLMSTVDRNDARLICLTFADLFDGHSNRSGNQIVSVELI